MDNFINGNNYQDYVHDTHNNKVNSDFLERVLACATVASLHFGTRQPTPQETRYLKRYVSYGIIYYISKKGLRD